MFLTHDCHSQHIHFYQHSVFRSIQIPVSPLSSSLSLPSPVNLLALQFLSPPVIADNSWSDYQCHYFKLHFLSLSFILMTLSNPPLHIPVDYTLVLSHNLSLHHLQISFRVRLVVILGSVSSLFYTWKIKNLKC